MIVLATVIMCFYSSIILSYIIRYKQRKPFTRQVQLFTWWPNALRPKSQKKGLDAKTDQGIPMKGVQGSKLHDRSDSVDTAIPASSAPNALVWTPKEQRKAEMMLWVCVGATTLIFIRSIYRSIELLDGWSGPIIENQGLFDALDGALMVSLLLATSGPVREMTELMFCLGWRTSSSSVSPLTCFIRGGGSPRCKNVERPWTRASLWFKTARSLRFSHTARCDRTQADHARAVCG